jgi:hypothetical protein
MAEIGPRIASPADPSPAPTFADGWRAGVEAAAKWCELVGTDWEEAGDYTKRDAAKYLAGGIRELTPSAGGHEGGRADD